MEQQSQEENKNVFEVLDSFSVTMKDLFRVFVTDIKEINKRARMLSINAGIEAARSGEAGRGFTVVASEMNKLSDETLNSAKNMETQANETAANLHNMTTKLANNVMGTRLSDLSLNNIELIDRNLYERSCDVRWWATDKSVVDAVSSSATDEDRSFASKRLGVILDAYTVYFDIVLCDATGKVIANGRPNDFKSQGSNQSNAPWFQQAMSQSSGNEYAFQTVHESSLVNGNRALVYACTVRQDGNANGNILGVLGVVFNYDSLAQTIMMNTALPEEEKKRSRVCITDDNGLVLADSHEKILKDTIDFEGFSSMIKEKKNYVALKYRGKQYLVGHAQSPGFETYKTGWHSFILQELVDIQEN